MKFSLKSSWVEFSHMLNAGGQCLMLFVVKLSVSNYIICYLQWCSPMSSAFWYSGITLTSGTRRPSTWNSPANFWRKKGLVCTSLYKTLFYWWFLNLNLISLVLFSCLGVILACNWCTFSWSLCFTHDLVIQDMNNAKLFSDEAANIYERAIGTLLKKNMLLYFSFADYEEVRPLKLI